MAVTTIAKIQHRRGVYSDLPTSLNEAELGWCTDTRQLFIGNSSPFTGNTQILTEYSANEQIIQNQWTTPSGSIITAVSRGIGKKLNDVVSVQDFGAVADGVTDNAPIINAAIAELFNIIGSPTTIEQTQQVTLFMPAGTYSIQSPLLLYPNLKLVGSGTGSTIILVNDNSMNFVMETVDSLGQSGANIGGTGGNLPSHITIKDITINTNNFKIDAVQLTRYRGIAFNNVEFIGGYVNGVGGDSGLYPNAAIRLSAAGATVPIYDCVFVNCSFNNFAYAVYADDPISNTTLTTSTINNCWRGVNIGQTPVNNGPSLTLLSGNRFTNIDSWGVYLGDTSSNPGVTSLGNSYTNVGITESTNSIYFGTSSTVCSSMGDSFSSSPGIEDAGSSNIILNSQQNNHSTWV